MTGLTLKTASVVALFTWLAIIRCSELERDNPIDPAADDAASEASIFLAIPLSKILLSVVHRVEAILVSAQLDSVVKELHISPLGPATGIIGTIAPGSGYALSLVGYDLEGNELFRGEQQNITIAAGDTVTVSIDLLLTDTSGSSGAAEDGSQQPAAAGSDGSGEQGNGSGEAPAEEEGAGAGSGASASP